MFFTATLRLKVNVKVGSSKSNTYNIEFESPSPRTSEYTVLVCRAGPRPLQTMTSCNHRYAGNIDFLTSTEHPSGFWGCSSSIVEATLVALPLLNGFCDSALRLRDTPSSCCLQWLVSSVQRATWSVARTSSGCTASFSSGVHGSGRDGDSRYARRCRTEPRAGAFKPI